MRVPRVVIAGTNSGAGKTTLTLGLLGALKRRGLRVQPFKVGPDYIDPGLHRVASGTDSHNLDAWMGTNEIVREVFHRHAQHCHIAVIEGVMGLFDGMRDGDCGSTAHIARLLQAPVILVVNARGMARSCAALVKGYREFDPEVNVAGVIFNHVGGPKHVESVTRVVEEEVGIPVLGTVKRHSNINMPERHLGLLPAAEHDGLRGLMKELTAVAEEDVELDRLLKVAGDAPPVYGLPSYGHSSPVHTREKSGACVGFRANNRVRLAVGRDEAFNFYYRDSLDYLEELGAELLYFRPLHDSSLPGDIDGIYLGGGFPEMFLPRLAENLGMRDSIRTAAAGGLPIYAECGGLMYLAESIVDFEGRVFDGVGLVPGSIQMQPKLEALGYVTARPVKESILARPGEELRGHEFHYSKMTAGPGFAAAYKLYGGRGSDGRAEGYARENILASYVHLHLRSNPIAAQRFLKVCAGRRDED